MEIWDLLNKDGQKTGQTMVRGGNVPAGLYMCLCRLQTLGHLSEGIVDTGKISARVCTKGCPVGHLSFQQERILLFPCGKFHGYGIAPVAADLHRIGGFDLLAGIQKGCTGVLLIGQQVSTCLLYTSLRAVPPSPFEHRISFCGCAFCERF